MGEALSGNCSVGYEVVCSGSKCIGLNLAWAGLILYLQCAATGSIKGRVLLFLFLLSDVDGGGHPSIISRHYGTCRRERRKLIKLPFSVGPNLWVYACSRPFFDFLGQCSN